MNILLPTLQNSVAKLVDQFDEISPERKSLLQTVATYLKQNKREKQKLIFICTHNSRRSHMGQLWAQAAAYYFGLNIECYSGGTEATAFYPSAVEAMQKVGFNIVKEGESVNPRYLVKHAKDEKERFIFSKVYNDPFNPQENFIAIMTCDSANEACPVITGALKKFPVLYLDPKVSDGTAQQAATYLERSKQIGKEMLYLMSLVKKD